MSKILLVIKKLNLKWNLNLNQDLDQDQKKKKIIKLYNNKQGSKNWIHIKNVTYKENNYEIYINLIYIYFYRCHNNTINLVKRKEFVDAQSMMKIHVLINVGVEEDILAIQHYILIWSKLIKKKSLELNMKVVHQLVHKYQVTNIMEVVEDQERKMQNVKKKVNIKCLLMRKKGRIIRKKRKQQ